jgi:glutathione S-transferase
MADLVLYHAVPSRSIVVHWMLEELGEPFALEMLDMQAEEHKTAEYLALYPMGKVPLAAVHPCMTP